MCSMIQVAALHPPTTHREYIFLCKPGFSVEYFTHKSVICVKPKFTKKNINSPGSSPDQCLAGSMYCPCLPPAILTPHTMVEIKVILM